MTPEEFWDLKSVLDRRAGKRRYLSEEEVRDFLYRKNIDGWVINEFTRKLALCE